MERTAPAIFLLSVFFFTACCDKAGDEKAIIQLLEKESATWRSGDGRAHAGCWEVKPYSRILVSTTDGKTFDVPPAAMKDTSNKGNGGTSSNSNYKFSIHGDFAWVSHDEVSTDTSGVKSYSHEFRMLERVRGHWKLTGQSIHMYKP